MDFNQCKLTKNEWNSIEIPISTSEKYVCELIIRGFNNVNITVNRNVSLISFLKITPTDSLDNYVYCKYLQNDMSLIASNYNIDYFKTVPKDNLKIMTVLAIKKAASFFGSQFLILFALFLLCVSHKSRV